MLTSQQQILDDQIATLSIDDLEIQSDIKQQLVALGYVTVQDVYSLETEGIALTLGIDFDLAQQFWQQIVEIVSTPDKWFSALAPKAAPIAFDLVGLLKPTLEEFMSSALDHRIHAILVRRFGLKNGKKYTLEEVGNFYEITRERTRQLQVKGLKILRDALLSERSLLKFKELPEQLLKEIQSVKRHFESELEPIRTEEEIFHMLSQRYQQQPSTEAKWYLRLLFSVFGWDEGVKLPGSFDVYPFWIIKQSEVEPPKLFATLGKITKLLHEASSKVSYFDIKVAVNRGTRTSDLTIRSAIKICVDIEHVGNDEFQIRFEHLRGAPDQAYRVLSELGQPVHAREIYREVSMRLAKAGEKSPTLGTVTNAMVGDNRFMAIGKSAWALAEWDDVIQNTIVELMVDFFRKTNQPAPVKDVYDYVKSKRPVKRNSVNTYLVDRPEFVRVSPGIYQLSEWPLPENTTTRQVVKWADPKTLDLIISIFNKKNTDTLPLNELTNELKQMTGVSVISYDALQKSPALEISVLSEHPRRLQARVIRDYKIVKQQTLREQIEIAVRETLRKQPEHTMPLAELRDKITKRGKVLRHTFYQYLSEMIDIQKNVVGGGVLV